MHEHIDVKVADMYEVYEVPQTPAEMLESAKAVVAGLQFTIRARDKSIEIAAETIAEKEAIIKDLREFMARCALRLARAGSYDHKGKNEVLLSAVADLLAISRNPIQMPDNDDIPF